MTAKCLFCKDTKIEPGIPGPCVWCEEIGPATTGAVERFTIAKLRYAGGAEHDVRYVSEVHYDAALGREAASANDLSIWKQKACEAAEREAALREELDALEEEFDTLEHTNITIKLSLAAAEQREVELKMLLCDVINEAPTGFAALKVDLAHRVNAAIKPAAEQTKICPNCKVCMGSPDFPENCLINGVKP